MCITEIKTQPYPLRQSNLQFIQPLCMYGADQNKNMLNQAQLMGVIQPFFIKFLNIIKHEGCDTK